MNWTIAKYRGQDTTLPAIVLNDPHAFFSACEQKAFPVALAHEVEYIYRRARRIKIPPLGLGEPRLTAAP